MDRIRIEGGRRLTGSIPISGAKNAALPLMIASLLTDRKLALENVPELADVVLLKRILANHGVDYMVSGKRAGDVPNAGETLTLSAENIVDTTAPYELVSRMRASFWVIGPLVAQYPEPRVEMHPRLAEKLGIADGDWTVCETRRGEITLRAMVVTTIRPDTVFIPYHWAGPKSINQLTIAAQDPISKIPEYKVCAVRIHKAEADPAYLREREPQQ